jgi:tetratricopeptide (TPR) repeat protein
VPLFRQQLSITENSLGEMLYKAEGFAAAEKVWLEASTRLRKLTAGKNALPAHRGDLGLMLGNLGWLYLQNHDFAKARDHLLEGTEHLEHALRSNPDHPDYSQSLRGQYIDLSDASLKLGEYLTATDAASKLLKTAGVTLADKFAAACILIRSGTAEATDESLESNERARRAQRHFDDATALLDDLKQHDFHDFTPLDEPAMQAISWALQRHAKLKKSFELLTKPNQ